MLISLFIFYNVCTITQNGVPVPYVDEFKYLGNLFQSDVQRL